MIVDNEVTGANTCTLIFRLSPTHQKLCRFYMEDFICTDRASSNVFLFLDSSRTVVLRHGPEPVGSDLQKDVLQKSRDHAALCNPRKGTLRPAKPKLRFTVIITSIAMKIFQRLKNLVSQNFDFTESFIFQVTCTFTVSAWKRSFFDFV